MQNKGVIQVEELPLSNIHFGSTYSIDSKNLVPFTHGFFKYPCKFIPHVPRWAIRRYLGEKKGWVLDPFSGSGTTLVESVLLKKGSLGIDCDPFGRLLSKVKSTPLNEDEISKLKNNLTKFFKIIEEIKPREIDVPSIPNIDLWFSPSVQVSLAKIKGGIKKFKRVVKSKNTIDFLSVCFASIIRKVSNADDQSPKPYVSKKFLKVPPPVIDTFKDYVKKYIKNLESFSSLAGKNGSVIVGNDARQLNVKTIKSFAPHGIDLAVTSPPYINAFDYVRTLKLENLWLGMVDPEELILYRKRQIGTECVSDLMQSDLCFNGNVILNRVLKKVYTRDRKRGYIILKFFQDMQKNIEQILRVLKPQGVYCIVIGDSQIRGVKIPTHKILIDIAQKVGFNLDCLFSYEIKNPYLRFPRNGRGGLIKKDWVISLRKDI